MDNKFTIFNTGLINILNVSKNTVEMKAWRCCRVIRTDRTPNEEIGNIMVVDNEAITAIKEKC